MDVFYKDLKFIYMKSTRFIDIKSSDRTYFLVADPLSFLCRLHLPMFLTSGYNVSETLSFHLDHDSLSHNSLAEMQPQHW